MRSHYIKEQATRSLRSLRISGAHKRLLGHDLYVHYKPPTCVRRAAQSISLSACRHANQLMYVLFLCIIGECAEQLVQFKSSGSDITSTQHYCSLWSVCITACGRRSSSHRPMSQANQRREATTKHHAAMIWYIIYSCIDVRCIMRTYT